MAIELRHITRINDTQANVRANLDLAQSAILSDQDEEWVYNNDDASKLYYIANQFHWNGAAIVYEDVDFAEIEAHDDILVSEFIKLSSATDNQIRFQADNISIVAGGATVLNLQDDRAFFSLPLGVGTSSPDFMFEVEKDLGVAAAYHTIARIGKDVDTGIKFGYIGDGAVNVGTFITGETLPDAALFLGSRNAPDILRIDDQLRIGIGNGINVVPASMLEIYGDSASKQPTLTITGKHATAYDPQIQFRTDLTPTVKFSMGVDSADDKFKIFSGTGIGGTTEFVIDDSGHLGIGNDDPRQDTLVFGGNKVLTVGSTTATNRGSIEIGSRQTGDDAIVGTMLFYNAFNTDNSASTRPSIAAISARTVGSAVNSGGQLTFFTKVSGGSVTEAARFDASQNFGIGTGATVNAKLDVDGTSRFGDSTTNYLNVTAAGTTSWFGTAGLIAGSVYGNEIDWTQANAAQNQWYNISDADMITGYLKGFTHDGNGKLTVLQAGTYDFVWYGEFQADASGVHIQISISVNGTPLAAQGMNHIETSAQAREHSASGCGHVDLALNDTVEMAIRTTDAGTPDLAIDHLGFKLTVVGGT